MGKQWKQCQTLFWRAPKSLQIVTATMKLKDACFLEGKLWLTRQHIQMQRHYFANSGQSRQSYGFSNSHVWMWELDYKESWAPKNWYFWTVVLQKTLESPLDCKEIQPVHPKGNLSWIFIRRTDAEAETPNTLATRCKEQTHWKRCWERLKAGGEGADRGWDGWMASLTDGHESEQTLGAGDGQGGLACCGSWGLKESDTTERLNWIERVVEYKWHITCLKQLFGILNLVAK